MKPQDNNIQNDDAYKEAKEKLENNKISKKDLGDVILKVNEIDFYHLLCTFGYEFNQIARTDLPFFKTIFYKHKDSFKRLRYTSPQMFRYIGNLDDEDELYDEYGNPIDENGNIIEDKKLAMDYDPYADFFYYFDLDFQLIDRDRDRLLNITATNRNDITNDDYHNSRRIIAYHLSRGETQFVIPLLDELNNYDFCDLLMHDRGMRQLIKKLSKEDFVSLFSKRYQALRYLYEKENIAFELIFASEQDFDLLNEQVAKPRGDHFVRRAIQKIIEAQRTWSKLSNIMQKSISQILSAEDREKKAPSWLLKWLGNETMDLRHLSAIISFANNDIQSINEYSDLQQSCILFCQSYPILLKAQQRIDMYQQNYENGKEQFALIDYFVKTVCISVISAGVGAAFTTGLAGSFILSTATSVTLEGINQMADGGWNAGNMGQAAGLGIAGAGAGEFVVRKFAPGPAGKVLADITFGFVSSVSVDAARGNISLVSTKEKHNKEMDIALYAYYMAQIGGIDYDEDSKEYYVSQELPDEQGEAQKAIVERLNELYEED